MDVTAELDTPVAPQVLFAAVDDLASYPRWLDIVARASAVEAAASDPGPAWSVDLRARLGPLARAKRLRMVRTVHEPASLARFERAEVDGRRHSAWILDAAVTPTTDGSRLTMALHYGGGLFGPVLERLLVDEIERSKPHLLAVLRG